MVSHNNDGIFYEIYVANIVCNKKAPHMWSIFYFVLAVKV